MQELVWPASGRRPDSCILALFSVVAVSIGSIAVLVAWRTRSASVTEWGAAPSRSFQRTDSALVWFGVFFVLQVVAFFVALALDPAGFDPCGTEGEGPRGLQRAIAAGALLLSVLYAGKRIRGWYGVPAGACLGLAGLVYWIVLRDSSSFAC